MSAASPGTESSWEAAWRRVPGPARVLLAVGVLPQVLLWAIGSYLYLPFGHVSLDYLLLAAVFALLPRLVAAGALGVVFLVDAALRLGAAYGFQPVRLVESIEALLLLNPTQTALGLGALVASTAIVAVLADHLTRDVAVGQREVGALAAVGALALSVSAFGWQPYVNEESRYIVPEKPVASQVGRFWQGVRKVRTARTAPPARVGIPAAAAGLHEALRKDEAPEKVALVIGEGLGLFTGDPSYPELSRGEKGRSLAGRLFEQGELNRKLWSVFDDSALAARYEVEMGVLPKRGSTIDAEMRELCRVQVDAHTPNPAFLPREECLPELAEAQGYHTVGVHGNTGALFDRQTWWTGLGFEETWFNWGIATEAGLERTCPPSMFPHGLCDSDVAAFLTERYLEAEGRQFVYWLTLNPHQQVGTPDPSEARFPCQEYSATRESEPLCHELQLQDIVLRQVRRMALATEKPAQIVLVGDHAVHFLRAGPGQYVREGWVPYVLLRPKSPAAGGERADE